jgi:hypothetical protein
MPVLGFFLHVKVCRILQPAHYLLRVAEFRRHHIVARHVDDERRAMNDVGFGVLGRIANQLFVIRQVRQTFLARQRVLESLLRPQAYRG